MDRRIDRSVRGKREETRSGPIRNGMHHTMKAECFRRRHHHPPQHGPYSTLYTEGSVQDIRLEEEEEEEELRRRSVDNKVQTVIRMLN
ncbi:hypothetical protein AKJ16_DCAP01042 [Drosera capensis]